MTTKEKTWDIFTEKLEEFGTLNFSGQRDLVGNGTAFRRACREEFVAKIGCTWPSSGAYYQTCLKRAQDEGIIGSIERGKIPPKKDASGQVIKRTRNTEEREYADDYNNVYSCIRVDQSNTVQEVYPFSRFSEAEQKADTLNSLANSKTGQWKIVQGTPDPGENFDVCLRKSFEDGGCKLVE